MSGIALEAEVSLSLGEQMEGAVHGALKKHHEGRPRPSYLRKSNSVLSSGSGVQVVNLGSPPNGRMWQCIFITLFGSDDHTAVASVVGGLYVGNAANPGLSGLVLPGLAFPSGTQLSDKVAWVHGNEELFVATSVPGTAGQQFGANASILEWRDEEIAMRSGR